VRLQVPEPLSLRHQLQDFDCGKPPLNEWLLRHARHAQTTGSVKTFVVEAGQRVAGYFSLTVGQVDTIATPERIRESHVQYPMPVVILARLAVSLSEQGRGIGYGMLQDAIRRTLAIAGRPDIRTLLTHPVGEDDARFYERFGFVRSPVCAQQVLLLLKDAWRSLERTAAK